MEENKKRGKHLRFSHLLIFFMFLLVVLFGRKFYEGTSENVTRPNTFNLGSGSSFSPDFNLKINKNNTYRMIFNFKLELDKKEVKKNPVELYCISPYFEEQLITKTEVNRGESWLAADLYARDDCSRVIIRQIKKNIPGILSLKSINYFQISSLSAKPAIIGETDFNAVISSSYDDKNTFKFVRKRQSFGQIIKIDSDLVSGVNLKMRFVGSGGGGNYALELKKAYRDKDGNFSIAKERLAYYYFNKSSAKNFLTFGNEEVYLIPLTAKINADNFFYIGVTNAEVNFNLINTLEIMGGTHQGNLVKEISGRLDFSKGSIYHQIYGAAYRNYSDSRLLTNQLISDLGNGEGLFEYHQNGELPDFLDVYDYKGKVFSDNVMGGVSARAEKDTEFIYRFDSIYPLKKVYISLTQPGADFTPSVFYYSLNNKVWKKFDNCIGSDLGISECNSNRIEKVIKGNLGHEIYIKIGYNKEKMGIIRLFGLNGMVIRAELDTN